MNLLMLGMDFLYKLLDLPIRIKFLSLRILGRFSVFSQSDLSDSDSTPYSDFVRSVIAKESLFTKFRRDYSYRLILEHVDFKLGLKYLRLLNESTIAQYVSHSELKKLSTQGSPRKFYFSKIGWVSPTVIRYLYVHQHITQIFNQDKFSNVGEIGVGFGGQCAVSSTLGQIQKYSAYDLPEVLSLSEKMLSTCGINVEMLQRKDIENVLPASYELVISNYAFSELPSQIQSNYAHEVLSRSKRGYLTMNSGRSNHTGRSQGKLSLKEIFQLIPGCEIIEEYPLTGPDNYIIIWGRKAV